MEDLSRAPTKIERLLTSLLSAVATLIFGAVSVLIFSGVPVSYPALAIFTVLFLVGPSCSAELLLLRGGVFQSASCFA